MKREILFRGKRVDNGEWHYGCLIINGHYDVAIYDPNFDEYKGHEVHPETVGQFTGLTDKNGTKIFEGDVCKFKANYTYKPCGFLKAIVVVGMYKLELHADNGYVYDAEEETDEFPYAHCEVIGNIHDNPELLNK